MVEFEGDLIFHIIFEIFKCLKKIDILFTYRVVLIFF